MAKLTKSLGKICKVRVISVNAVFLTFIFCRIVLIKKAARRTEGMGLKIVKFHAIIHMAMDIDYFGVPMEFDTGSN